MIGLFSTRNKPNSSPMVNIANIPDINKGLLIIGESEEEEDEDEDCSIIKEEDE